MRSRIDFIADSIAGNLEESGTPIVLAWNVWPSDSVRDAVTNVPSGSPTEAREDIGAFVHFVGASSATINLIGRDGLVFLLPTGPLGALEKWTNKPMSSQLAAFWDTMQAGRRLFQTVLLRRGT